MNAFLSLLEKHSSDCCLRRDQLTTLQVNMGNLCNQSCVHCHIEASPNGDKTMSRAVVDSILRFLSTYKIKTLDITGGAPELNPNFDYLVTSARGLVDEIIVRSNLTVLFEPGKEYLAQFYKKNKVHLICSLPCYLKNNVDVQRGNGVFDKSVKALKLLNNLGFSRQEDLVLDLVYNPTGTNLPPQQPELERDYKNNLDKNYGINFNHLFTITNVPIKRFKDYLKSKGEYEKYFDLLKNNFNPQVLDNLMCRTFLSVAYDGKLYDCDFNLALGLFLKDTKGDPFSIDKLNPDDLQGREIIIGEHCLSCTAGSGSSCQGALDQQNDGTCGCSDKKDVVKDYYGKVLKESKDLKTNACCPTDSFPKEHRSILSKLESEVLNRFYGCGSPIPPLLKDCTVLDLGCGTGRDVFLASYLVGENGFVIGVDMTDEQLAVANKYKELQMEKFGFKHCNVDFKKGYIENLKEIGIADNSVDIVISNCVINLSADKRRVFSEIFRILKPGGELYFSDVLTGRRVPDDVKDDPILYGECLGGALYIEDFRRVLRDIGCLDYRVVSKRRITLNNEQLEEKVGMVDFYSMTIRAFKLNDLEDICEDYGQLATYLGTIPGAKHQFILDDEHTLVTNKPMLVCGNTASILSRTRYAKHFRVEGSKNNHFGTFNCKPMSVKIENRDSLGGGCC